MNLFNHKKITLTLAALALTAAISAQNITVTFAGRNAANNAVVALDSVRVFNITRNIDTVTTQTTIQIPATGTGIGSRAADNLSFAAGDVFPNPSNGTASVEVSLDRQTTLNLSLFGLDGKTVALFCGNYGAGSHTFKLSAAAAGIYLLQITDGKSRISKKVVCAAPHSKSQIQYEGTEGQKASKSLAQLSESEEGDLFMFVGYADGFAASTVYASPTENTTITFEFEQPHYILQRHEISVRMPSFVDILFTVVDENGRGIDNLANADFMVKENGTSVSPTETSRYIRKMNSVPYLIQTVLMLDNSRSLTLANLESIKQSAMQLIRNKDKHQEFAIYCFSEQATLVRDFTSDTTLLLNAISSIERGGYSTNLYGSYITGIERISNSFTKELVKLGYMVFFTDGDDTQGSATLAQAIAARGSKRAYMIGLGNELDGNSLNQLANPSPYFSITDPAQLTAVFNQIQEDVITYARSFYWLNYMSPKRNTSATLRLEIIGNDNAGASGYIEETFDATDFEAADEGVYVNAYQYIYGKYGITSPRYTLGGEETFTLEAVTYHAAEVPQYVWSVSNAMATITPDPSAFNKATLTIPDFNRIGGEIIITVTDEANGFTNTVRAWRGTFVKLFAGVTSENGNADGTGIEARFSGFLKEIELAANGYLYVVDGRNKRIAKINPATAAVTTFATIPSNLYNSNDPMSEYFDLNGLAIDGSNNFYTSMDAYGNQYIFKITPSGTVSLFAIASASYMDWGSDGKLYVSNGFSAIYRYVFSSGNSWAEDIAGSGSIGYADGTGDNARFSYPCGIALDNQNNIYVADWDNYRIRKITPSGVVTTLAGNGTYGNIDGTGEAASFKSPRDLVVGNDGNIYVTDLWNVRKITPEGVVTTIVDVINAGETDGNHNSFDGIEMDSDGNFYATSGNAVFKIIVGQP